MRTKEKLALVLAAEGMPDLAALARAGRFDDFESESATPCVDLYNEFIRRKRKDLAQRVANGEWDSTAEESEAWARSEDGQDTFRRLIPPAQPHGASGLGVTVEQREKLEEIARLIAQRIGSAVEATNLEFDKKIGFAVLLFTMGEKGFMTYVSNAQRADMILALREQADTLERKLESPPLKDQQ